WRCGRAGRRGWLAWEAWRRGRQREGEDHAGGGDAGRGYASGNRRGLPRRGDRRKRRGDPHHNHDRHGGHGRILGARLVRCRCAALPWTGSRRIVRGVSVVVRCALLGVRGLERA
ncbi:unnamed protein product, partial [Ascophyllum nodosum]